MSEGRKLPALAESCLPLVTILMTAIKATSIGRERGNSLETEDHFHAIEYGPD